MDAAHTYYQVSAGARDAFPTLEGRIEVDVCVVGGGFAGLNTALGLAERGVRDVCVLEAQQVGFGASGRNGGFVFGGFSLGEGTLVRHLGAERARALYQGTLDAIRTIDARIRRYAIACEQVHGGVLWVNWFRDPEVLRSRQRLMQEQFGSRWQWIGRDALREQIRTERYGDALFEPDAFHFHPLKYAHGIARAAADADVAIYERTPATALAREGQGWRVVTPRGVVHAKRVVLACGGYLAGLRAKVDRGVLPIATYVMSTAPLGARMRDVLRTRAAIYDSRFAFDYYRPLPDTRLLWGGRISIRDRSPHEVKQLLRADMLKVFPQLEDVEIEHAWSGLMSYARHQMPQIGEIEPGLWLAQAFGGHGVAPTTMAGEVLASAIAEGDTRWREFARYGLVSAMKPAGFVGAQINYWWLQMLDELKDRRERRAA